MDYAGNEVYRVPGNIRWPESWDFSICIGDRLLIIFLTYSLKNRSFKKNIHNLSCMTANTECHLEVFVTARK